MAQSVCILLPTEDRARLTAVIGNRNGSQKQLQPHRIRTLETSNDPVFAASPHVPRVTDGLQIRESLT